MADDVKRSEQVCFKVTERMFIDLHRLAALEDRTPSDFMCGLLRRYLYGHMVRLDATRERSTSADEVNQ
jgi:hypothetical protein